MSNALATFCTHGGRVADARAVYGEGDWIDLSTGIAPWAWPVNDLALGWDRLPEPDEIGTLESAAGQAFGVDAAQVVAVPGTDLALRLLALVLGAERPAVVVPGYAGHRTAWPDADVVSSPLHEREGSGVGPFGAPRASREGPTHPQPLPFREGSKHDLLVLASPANPDGRVSDPAMLRDLSQRLTVVVDEAYADPSPRLAPHASDRLIVLRSFGKFYGLPGLRLGFVIAGDTVAAQLRTVLGDWPVSSAAVAIGTAAYRDTAWRRTQQARIDESGVMLDRVLGGAGLPIVGSAPLFRLIACDRAGELFAHLARHAILTRPFADQPDRLRIGLPRGAAALDRLAIALEEFVR